jgi:nitrogenase-stabilizing/protective protein
MCSGGRSVVYTSEFEQDLQELVDTEDFLEYFGVSYDPDIVRVYRLRILKRFRDYLEQAQSSMPARAMLKRVVYQRLLRRAYQDFVGADAQTGRVVEVFRRQPSRTVLVPVDSIACSKTRFQ